MRKRDSNSLTGRRSPSSRRQLEIRQRRLLLLGTAVVTLLVASLLIYGAVTTLVWPARQPVAEVSLANAETVVVTSREFQSRLRFERDRYSRQAGASGEMAAQLYDVYGFGQMVLERIGQELLIHEEAAVRGLMIDEAEIDKYIEEAYTYVPPTATPTPAVTILDDAPTSAGNTPGDVPVVTATIPWPTLTPTVDIPFSERYRRDLKVWQRYGVNETVFRDIIRTHLLEEELRQLMGPAAYEGWLALQNDRIVLLDNWYDSVPQDRMELLATTAARQR